MNKFAFLILFATFSFVNFQSLAQNEKGEFRLLVGISVGTDASVDDTGQEGRAGVGLTGGIEYLISDRFSIAPSYTSFFKKEYAANSSIQLSVINIDARYYLGTESNTYALVGYASSTSKAKTEIIDFEVSQSGLNFGLGINLPFGEKLYGNVEAKYQAIGSAQIAGTVGIGIRL